MNDAWTKAVEAAARVALEQPPANPGLYSWDAADEAEREYVRRFVAGPLRAALASLEAEGYVLARADALREAITDNVWNDYNTGIVTNGQWMDGAMSAAEDLADCLGLSVGWHDDEMVRSLLPAEIDRRVNAAAPRLPGTEEK